MRKWGRPEDATWIMKHFYRLVCITLLLWLAASLQVGLFPENGTAQESSQEVKTTAPEEKQINLTELMPLSNALTHNSLELQRNLANLPDLTEYDRKIKEINERLRELARHVDQVEAIKGYDYDRLVDLEIALKGEREALKNISQPLVQTIGMLETAKRKFTQEKASWQKLCEALPENAHLDSVEPILTKARSDIDEALASITKELGPVADTQRRVLETQDKLQVLGSRIETMLAAVRVDIFNRASPSMFSPQYYQEFKWNLLRQVTDNLYRVDWPGSRFIAKWGWLVFLQLVFVVAAAGLLIHNRGRFRERNQWARAARRPASTALLLAVVGGWPIYSAIPSLWRFLLWSVLAVTVSRVAAVLIDDVRRKRLIAILAVLLIGEEYFRTISFPVPLERIYIFLLAIVGLRFCFGQLRARREGRDPCLSPWISTIAGIVFAVVFIAELGGFSNLSKHVFVSSLKTVFLVLGGWIIAQLIRCALDEALEALAARETGSWFERARPVLERSWLLTKIFIVVALSCLILVIWKFYEGPLDAVRGLTSFGFTIGGTRITLGLALLAGAVLYLSFLLSWSVQTVLLDEVLSKRKLQKGAQLAMARLVHYALISVGILCALAFLGLNLRNITIIGGALGVGIGFGLQTIVNNFVCGLILLFERPIKVGDYIEIGGQWAEIKDIGLRATAVQTFDRADIVVPNSDLISNQVVNWTRSDRLARLKIPVGVAYGSDVTRVMQILMECVDEHREILRSPEPKVFFVGFGDSSLNFEVRFFLKDIDQWYVVQSDIHKDIDKRFREAGIEIPFPQRDIHLRSGGSERTLQVDPGGEE